MFDPFGDNLGHRAEDAAGDEAPPPAPPAPSLDPPVPSPEPAAAWFEPPAPSPEPAAAWFEPPAPSPEPAAAAFEPPAPSPEPTPFVGAAHDDSRYSTPPYDYAAFDAPTASQPVAAVPPSSVPPSSAPPVTPMQPSEPGRRRRSPLLASLVAVSLIASGFAVARASQHNTTTIVRTAASSTPVTAKSTTVATSSGTTEPIAAVAAELAPSVVQIETNEGLGSGFIYDSSGDILTAAHVVTGAGDTVTVRLADGSTQTGKVVGADAGTDIAVVRIDLSGTKATVASLAVGDALQAGQTAVAVGSPFGLESTVTAGIVSAVDRAMQTTDGAEDMIQTDAPINPGNSGGPLADLQGRVIGINDQIESESGSSSGVGFAIPIDTAKAVADKLVAGQPVTFAFLGVQTEDSGQGVVGNGAIIVNVESGSPADKAGLQQGDVVTKIGTTPIDDATSLSASIRGATPGTKVDVTVKRNGSTRTIAVTLGSTSAT